jgi:Arc/MetJ family transcription regulator
MAAAKVTVSLDANLALEVMVLSGTTNPQDAVEVVLRDYLQRGQRTEARTGDPDDGRRSDDVVPYQPPQG